MRNEEEDEKESHRELNPKEKVMIEKDQKRPDAISGASVPNLEMEPKSLEPH